MKGLKNASSKSPPPQAEADWAGGGAGDRPCGAKGCGESEGEGGGLCRQMPTKNREPPQGGERGGGLLGDDPVASRDGHRAGGGVERGGVETGEDDVENFI